MRTQMLLTCIQPDDGACKLKWHRKLALLINYRQPYFNDTKLDELLANNPAMSYDFWCAIRKAIQQFEQRTIDIMGICQDDNGNPIFNKINVEWNNEKYDYFVSEHPVNSRRYYTCSHIVADVEIQGFAEAGKRNE